MTTVLPSTADLAGDEDTRSYVELILDRPRAADQVVLADATRSLDAQHLRDEVHAVARVLDALHLGAGDVVALLVGNECAALTVRYGAHLAGCATVHLPDHGDVSRLGAFLAEVRPDVVVVGADRAERAAAALRTGVAPSRSPRLLSVGRVATEVLAVEGDVLEMAGALVAAGQVAPFTARALPHQLACLVASGGTTGLPKASLRSFADWSALVRGPEAPDRRQLVCTPLAYVGQVLADQTLLGGGSVVLRPPTVPFDPAAVLGTIESERITHLCLVEPALVDLLDHDDLTRSDLSSLVALNHIGADASPSLRGRLWDRVRAAGLGDVLVHTYGSSETGLVSVLSGADYSARRPDLLATAGRPLPGVHVRLDGCDEPDGLGGPSGSALAEGEIVVSSAGVCIATTRHPVPGEDPAWRSGLADRPGVRARATGDWGVFGPGGRLTVRGRLDDAVPAPGGPLFPVDVQEALCTHPDVAYAVAVPSETADRPMGGFVAVVRLLPGRSCTTVQLMEHVRRSPGRRIPLDAVVLCDAVPVTEQGKPDRAAIAEVIAADARLMTAAATDGVTVRPGTDADVDALWRIFREVLDAGVYYALDETTTRADAVAYWTRNDGPWFVAERDGRVVGACMIHPNQPGHGAHVANAAFVVDARVRGHRVGRHLVQQAVDAARDLGYRSMQFNLVVSTNLAAVRLYREMGFRVVGRCPEAFRLADGRYVDALLFHRPLRTREDAA